jgi:hypothetical protein
VKLPFTTGIEFTYLTKNKAYEENLSYAYKNLITVDMDKAKLKTHNIMCDEYAIEIASPVFKTWKEIEKFYGRMNEIVTKYPLVTHRKDTVSGGGHIHQGIPDKFLKNPVWLLCYLVNVFRDITNRPYLLWIFNEPSNYKSSRSFVWMKPEEPSLSSRSRLYDILFNSHSKIDLYYKVVDVLQMFDDTKGFACRVDSNNLRPTIEYRFFDTPTSWKETELFVKFAGRYLNYLTQRTLAGHQARIYIDSPKDITILSRNDQCLHLFKSLLNGLDLNFKDYEPLIQKNYETRKRLGLLI